MVEESTARAPGVILNIFISPGDDSRPAVLDIGQLVADLRTAFVRSLVEERHHCRRTCVVELGA
ncbi:hypothetical protein BD309DRAFT_663947 [Dichomitus squalens]|nr:hypothetical protein BD309DRAFT_663947 [Dichomitus squalens]